MYFNKPDIKLKTTESKALDLQKNHTIKLRLEMKKEMMFIDWESMYMFLTVKASIV